ncbi:MAG TPA: NAD(P)/FAD-dependent oxidoreductase [Vicinamibacterales bacterium]|nr:NAD(P)/FAD-dependent oxidoreductase [Vicinamibacterales bacterium]
MHDVVIIGGGPAGLFAGARLAAAGLRTALLEEHSNVGEPVHCTGVLSADAFDEFNLSRRSLLNELTAARFTSPAGHHVTYSGDRVEAVVIDRRAFDQDLLERAESGGVIIERGARVTSVQVDSAGATVKTPSAAYRARACILACGANYALHRQVGFGMPRLFLHTAQLELPARRLGDVELHFGAEVAPKGFGWIVPVARSHEQCARIGVMCDGDAPKYFQRLAARVAPRWGVAGAERGRPRQKILPLAPISRTYGDRLLAIGDAAGLVKPTTGGGIYYSLVSAAFAAETLINAMSHGDLSAPRLAAYEERWRERLSAEFQAQTRLRMLAHRMSDADIEQLFDLARTDGVMPIVRRTASFNRHRNLILALLKHPPVRQLLLRRLAF